MLRERRLMDPKRARVKRVTGCSYAFGADRSIPIDAQVDIAVRYACTQLGPGADLFDRTHDASGHPIEQDRVAAIERCERADRVQRPRKLAETKRFPFGRARHRRAQAIAERLRALASAREEQQWILCGEACAQSRGVQAAHLDAIAQDRTQLLFERTCAMASSSRARARPPASMAFRPPASTS